MKLDRRTGQRLWSAYHATPRDEKAMGVSLDKDFNLVVTGQVSGSGNFRTTGATGYYQQNNEIGLDAFILCYNRANQRMWTTFFGSGSAGTGSTPYNDDRATSAVLNNDSKLFITGSTNVKNNSLPLVRWNNVCYYDSVVADVGTPKTDGFSSMFDLTELTIVGISDNHQIAEAAGWILYPNPNNGIFTIKFLGEAQEKVNVSVFNIVGQVVYESNISQPEGNKVNLDIGELKKGIYFVKVSDKINSQTVKIIIQ
jgi:hypothetical protein